MDHSRCSKLSQSYCYSFPVGAPNQNCGYRCGEENDLAGSDIETVINAVKKINLFAVVERSSFARIGFKGKKNPFVFFPSEESTESCRPDLQSVVIKTNQIISLEKLKLFIESVKIDFIRFKGFVNTAKDKKVVVQGIFDDYTIKEVEWFAGSTELV